MEGVRPISPPGKRYYSSEEVIYQNFMKTNFYPAGTVFSIELEEKESSSKITGILNSGWWGCYLVRELVCCL